MSQSLLCIANGCYGIYVVNLYVCVSVSVWIGSTRHSKQGWFQGDQVVRPVDGLCIYRKCEENVFICDMLMASEPKGIYKDL